jgi:hypothetical protein
MGEATFAISAASAQLERQIIAEQVRSGLAGAQAEGKRIGRPPVEIDAELVGRLRSSGMSWTEIARAHPRVGKPGGGRGRPSVATVRRAHREHYQDVARMVD